MTRSKQQATEKTALKRDAGQREPDNKHGRIPGRMPFGDAPDKPEHDG